MAEYGKPLPKKPKKGIKDLSTQTIYLYILIPMITIKLIIGDLNWLNIFSLFLFLMLLVTMIDSVVETDWVRAYDRNKMRFVPYSKHQQPFMYWSNVIVSWPFGILLAFAFIAKIKPS